VIEASRDELIYSTSRLSASRVLRARKVLAFIFDKLDLGAAAAAHRGRQSSVASINSRITALPFGNKSGTSAMAIPGGGRGAAGAAAGQNQSVHLGGETDQPEDLIELVCGDTVVDPLITLAALKQYYGSGGDMLLLYRPKKHV
jgi:WD repeat-containing protein 48